MKRKRGVREIVNMYTCLCVFVHSLVLLKKIKNKKRGGGGGRRGEKYIDGKYAQVIPRHGSHGIYITKD